MPARCPDCRGMGFTFDVRTSTGAGCERCDGTGLVLASKDIPQHIRVRVSERSGGVCEVCFAARATDKHHRKFRSRAVRTGEHSVENILDLCGPGNAFGCHGDAHGDNPPDGLAIDSWDARPIAEIPFTDKLGRRWLLNTDGTKELAA